MNQLDFDHMYAHVVSLGAIAGTIAGWLPYFAWVPAAVWYCLQIWESKTVMDWRGEKDTPET